MKLITLLFQLAYILSMLENALLLPITPHNLSNKSVEEQRKIIRQSTDLLNFELASGRELQTKHAQMGKISKKNGILAQQKIQKISENMLKTHTHYKAHIGNWIEKESLHNAAVPNKHEIPLYLEAKRSSMNSFQLHHNWLEKDKWPKPSWDSAVINHQRASANGIKHQSIHNVQKARKL